MQTIAPRTETGPLAVYRPLVEKVVAALGALVTHQIAYLLASMAGLNGPTLSDHGHLSAQWAIVTPTAVMASAGFVIWQLRGLGFRSAVSAGNLSGLVVAFFVIQELVEGLLGGRSATDVMTHPAVIAGLAIGPLVAVILSRFLAGVTELAAKFIGPPTFIGSDQRIVPIPVPVRCTPARPVTRSRPRAPPF